MPQLNVLEGGRTSRAYRRRVKARAWTTLVGLAVGGGIEFAAWRHGVNHHTLFLSLVAGAFYGVVFGLIAGTALFYGCVRR